MVIGVKMFCNWGKRNVVIGVRGMFCYWGKRNVV